MSEAVDHILFEFRVIEGYLQQSAKPDALPLEPGDLMRLASKITILANDLTAEVRAALPTKTEAA
jgi:hypothetical protein